MDDITKKLIDLTREPADGMVADIKRRHIEAGQKVTGRTSDLLRIEPTDKGFNLIGWTYSGTYEEGRAPGKMPPSEALIEWARAKGITFKSESQARSWAYCLARKIAKEGTQRYKLAQQGKPVDIFQTPIANMREAISRQIVFYMSHEVLQTLLRADLKK